MPIAATGVAAFWKFTRQVNTCATVGRMLTTICGDFDVDTKVAPAPGAHGFSSMMALKVAIVPRPLIPRQRPMLPVKSVPALAPRRNFIAELRKLQLGLVGPFDNAPSWLKMDRAS